MGCAKSPEKVNLIVGLLWSDPSVFQKAKRSLERMYGRVDFESERLDFAHTDYYSKEMGEGLNRQFFGFKKLFDLENICAAKVMTNALERRLSRDGRRTVNIDPGYVNLSKVVLFSTKDYSHRIYLKKGIFAEVTLFYRDKRFNPWPWTYPDYQCKAYLDIFGRIRGLYKDKTTDE